MFIVGGGVKKKTKQRRGMYLGRPTLFEASTALLAVAATVCDPLYSDTLAKLDWRWARVCMICDGNDGADALVSADEGGRRLEWPVCLADVEIGMAYAGADHLDEALPRF